ncbi:glucose-6-phosphate dehydrogenase assembly protein OpcA [Pseudoclavibacter caeni]|jgi:glucose-6-phosphate dehydrogenase assembly protein OpcA|uniref:Glucose-6-phosphate dehydrogenase assembly protein OpcA n=2 Tax=Pseudoclavibacter caeni TaxID=908846 RepID=A0A7C8FXL2_9MICO|nr:glucose-6-phosphate dehydrogenase assembly protein OpcA [Pseudoclavibacter caeni]
MIIDMPDTDTASVGRRLVAEREATGFSALGRVLTLVVITRPEDAEHAVETAAAASREHPMRVITVIIRPDEPVDRLDAQLRLGADDGASEVVVMAALGRVGGSIDTLVMGLLLPDVPVVLWFTGDLATSPESEALASLGSLGRIAARRVSDVTHAADPVAALRIAAERYQPGDADLAWSQISILRAQLAATLDQPPYLTVTAARMRGRVRSPEFRLLAAWLVLSLGVPVTLEAADSPISIAEVALTRADGDITLIGDPAAGVTRLRLPDLPEQHLPLTQRTAAECLSEELRRLDQDRVYGDVLRRGLPLLDGGPLRDADEDGRHV